MSKKPASIVNRKSLRIPTPGEQSVESHIRLIHTHWNTAKSPSGTKWTKQSREQDIILSDIGKRKNKETRKQLDRVIEKLPGTRTRRRKMNRGQDQTETIAKMRVTCRSNAHPEQIRKSSFAARRVRDSRIPKLRKMRCRIQSVVWCARMPSGQG
jgi:hypothetical protein